MKKSRITCVVVAMAFLAAGFAIPLLAELGDAATTDLLCSGEWVFQGKGWSVKLTFKRDNTVFSQNETLAWRIVGNQVVIKHAKYDDFISLPLNPNGTSGHSNKGKGYSFTVLREEPKSQNPPPQTAGGGNGPGTGAFGATNQNPAAAQQQAPPISPEMQQKAADLIKTYHASLVFAAGKGGKGSGFIASMGGSNFLVTNEHIPGMINDAEFKTLDDTVVKGGAATVAAGRDIFRMALPVGGVPLEIMQDVEQNAAIGDDVAVLGNAGGGDVVNTIMGRIVGIGADRVEVDAPFVHGNSGSPIIHLKSGKVIGIASYSMLVDIDPATLKPMKETVIRRFGYRLDNVKTWQAVDWRAFYAQAAEMGNIESLDEDLVNIYQELAKDGRISDPGQYASAVIRNRISQWMNERGGNHSAEDRKMADASFYSFLKTACQSDVTAARQHLTYGYFPTELADLQRRRDALSKFFENSAKEVGN